MAMLLGAILRTHLFFRFSLDLLPFLIPSALIVVGGRGRHSLATFSFTKLSAACNPQELGIAPTVSNLALPSRIAVVERLYIRIEWILSIVDRILLDLRKLSPILY